MFKRMKLLINDSTDPAFNLALEELIASELSEEIVMLWRNAPAVIVGRNQNTEAEIDAEAVRERGIKVVRRITGGGAVYHDLGNINYTIAANDRQLDTEAFSRNAKIIIDVLRGMGVDAGFHGRNDILVDGRKISGSAKSVFTDRTLFHGTLLFDTDLSVLGKVLTPDEEKIKAKGIKSVRSRVANLKEFLPEWDVECFLQELISGLCKVLGLDSASPIPGYLIEKAEVLANEKYRSWQWNFGSNTGYTYHCRRRFPSGSVEVRFEVKDNRIAGMVFYGDFFGLAPASELADKLNGLCPSFEEISKVLKNTDVSEYISGVSADDLLTLFRLG